MPLQPFRRSIPLPEYNCCPLLNEISAAAPCRLVIYNIPAIGRVALTPSLYKGNVEKSTGDWGERLFDACSGRFQTFASLEATTTLCFNSPDEQFLGGRLMGYTGIGVTYGAMPEYS